MILRVLLGAYMLTTLVGFSGCAVGFAIEGGPGPIARAFGSVLLACMQVAWIVGVLGLAALIVMFMLGIKWWREDAR